MGENEKEITGTEEVACDVAVMKAYRKASEAMSTHMLRKNIQGLRFSIHRLEMEMKIYQETLDAKLDAQAQKCAGDKKGGESNAQKEN